jgi:hypothetical protein
MLKNWMASEGSLKYFFAVTRRDVTGFLACVGGVAPGEDRTPWKHSRPIDHRLETCLRAFDNPISKARI